MTGKARQLRQNFSRSLRFSLGMALALLLLLLPANSQIVQAQESTTQTPEDSSENTVPNTSAKDGSSACEPAPIVVPILPEKIPGYTELDPDTQLHVTGTAKVIELESYRLEITGKVQHTLSLAYDDLRCMPKIEAHPTLICPGFFQDTATWAGVPLKDVLELAGLQEGADQLRLLSADGYSTSLSLEEALSGENFLAYEWEGKPIPILHGFPVRAIFPDLQGNKWAKWLVKIEVR